LRLFTDTSLAAREHASKRVVAKDEVMNQCRGCMKARNDDKGVGEDFVYLCYIMREGAIAYPR
jgi:hypothetical protein